MNRTTTLKSSPFVAVALSCLLALGIGVQGTLLSATTERTFPTPQAAADALVAAAEKFDIPDLEAILGPEGNKIIHTGEPARDREIAQQFAEQARTKMDVTLDPKSKTRAFISVGTENWPFPVPIVKTGKSWSYDS